MLNGKTGAAVVGVRCCAVSDGRQ